MKTIHYQLAAILVVPFVFASCATRAGTAVAGAAAYKAYDDHKEQEQREDYAKYKYAQDKKKGNR